MEVNIMNFSLGADADYDNNRSIKKRRVVNKFWSFIEGTAGTFYKTYKTYSLGNLIILSHELGG